MISKFVIKLLTATAFGALFGQYIRTDYEKWHILGREAFLSHQSHRFDLYMANPGSGISHLVVCAILAVGLGALYEGIAFVGAKLISLISSGKAPNPGIS